MVLYPVLSLGGDHRRRKFIALLGSAAAWPLAARAQQTRRLPRIGFLSDQSERPHPFNARDYLVKRLRELGYQDQRNVVFEYRYAAGELNRLAGLASELAAVPVDVQVRRHRKRRSRQPKRFRSCSLAWQILLRQDWLHPWRTRAAMRQVPP
jgi:hypothetical protein